jgi:hypothetical protein
MSIKIKIIIISALCVVAGLCLFPPIEHDPSEHGHWNKAGHGLIFTSQRAHRLDTGRFAVELAGLVAVAGVCLVAGTVGRRND